ncbi:hypothetical protein RFM68_01625 [Mesorhizobium sp. MSK_1335]|uniref:Uncharacterized protein n=1 Tax=Mesorhizobium montanum TaxID=3072323 RepID=A0ABU4ZCU4_9HYPH|nr:hypothetical protein [Mesorhizobium sp. MSK_1335]MDX8523191.1 hypothetical protein [Mesorhizobium sp. MSK_1335]
MKRHEDKSAKTEEGEGISCRRPLERMSWAHLFWAILPRRRS